MMQWQLKQYYSVE